jgi:hypothetical protein
MQASRNGAQSMPQSARPETSAAEATHEFQVVSEVHGGAAQTLAVAATSSIALASFYAAIQERPDERIVLRRRDRILMRSDPGRPARHGRD